MRPPEDKAGVDTDTPTAEVGSEGGSPGDIEVVRRREPCAGTEATETWRPWRDDVETIARDETGVGRRSP
jgi:hypothetical protein